MPTLALYAALQEADTRLLKLVRDTAGPTVRSYLQDIAHDIYRQARFGSRPSYLP